MSLALFFFSFSGCLRFHCRTKDSQINRAKERKKNASFVRFILNALLTKFPYLITTRVQIGTETESAAVLIHLPNLFLLLIFFFFEPEEYFIRLWWPFRYAESNQFMFLLSFIRTMWRQTRENNYREICHTFGAEAHFTIYEYFYELFNISGSDKRRILIFPFRKPAMAAMQMEELEDFGRRAMKWP